MFQVMILKSCVLLGHHDCPESITQRLYDTIENIILQQNINAFYVGTHGNFDRLAYRVLCRLENKYPIKINVVLAYLNTAKSSYYDYRKTVFPNVLENTPARYAIVKRNNYMVDIADCLICYVNNSHSNAYTFAERAKRRNVRIINIGAYDFE